MQNEHAQRNVGNREEVPEKFSADPRTPTRIQFQEVPIGQFFEFRSRRYQRLGPRICRDEDGNGAMFHAQTEVLPDPFSRSLYQP